MTLPLQTSSSIGDSQGAAAPHNDAIPESTGEIIAYVLERFHNGTDATFADFLDEVAESLDEHMHKEEQILFPMFRNGGQSDRDDERKFF